MAHGSSPRTLEVQGDRVVVGEWSKELSQLVDASAEVRHLLRHGRHGEARSLVCSRSPEEQAALVAVDENPEEVLSLTAMDEDQRPGYLPAVVDRLPTETLAGLLVPREARHTHFNLEVLRTMSPDTFRRAVDETLDPVYYHGPRGRVSWEWLEAVTALADVSLIAELLQRVDIDVLEDAFLERIEHFDLHAVMGIGDAQVSAFRMLSEDAAGVVLPPIGDPATEAVAEAIHQAAPELLRRILRHAWERAGGRQ